MPTYQYACTACGHQFEAVQAFTDASLTECPECSGRLRKLFGAVGVVFKGDGFYRTDSRKKEKTSSSSTTSSAASTSDSAKPADSKPASTPASTSTTTTSTAAAS